MKRVLLVEDRLIRQNMFTANLDMDINNNPVLENICGGKPFGDFKRKISDNGSFETYITKYEVIITHRSALEPSERQVLIEIAKKHSKTVVFFSGGISSVLLQEVGKGVLLTINSKDFYSESLKDFLETPDLNILVLAFGKKWQVNLYADLLERLTYYLDGYSEEKPYPIIVSNLNLNKWEIDNYFSFLENKRVKREELEEVKEKIIENLNKII